MKHAPLTTTLLLLLATLAASAQDPKIRVRLSADALTTGERAKVKVKTAADGHLLVLRMNTEGHVKVIFPVDPTDDDRIRGGRELEVRGRGDREALIASERAGVGFILAVRTDQPPNFEQFVSGQRWNADALSTDSVRRDPESTLLSVADRMTGGQFDYDITSYRVGAPLPGDAYGYGNRYARIFGMYDPWYSSMYGSFGIYPYYVPGLTVGIGFGRYFPFYRYSYRGRGRRR